MIENEMAVFWNVGMLRKLLEVYPDDTPISVCGTPAVFIPDAEQQSILLETMDSDGYCDEYDREYPATDVREYLDFCTVCPCYNMCLKLV